MIIEVYDAFRSVGIADDAARRAAGALSDSGRQLDELKSEMGRRFTEVDRRFDHAELTNEKRFGKIEAELLVMKWMLGAIVAGVLSLIGKAFL